MCACLLPDTDTWELTGPWAHLGLLSPGPDFLPTVSHAVVGAARETNSRALMWGRQVHQEELTTVDLGASAVCEPRVFWAANPYASLKQEQTVFSGFSTITLSSFELGKQSRKLQTPTGERRP